jgi:LmbE family N-acetylglucosaminyl deacetylase
MGYATHGLVLTRGENGVGQDRGRYSREKEALAGARRMGLASLNIHQFPDARLASRRDEVKVAIEVAIQRLQPDVVLTHTRADLHFDHRLVHLATLEGARNVPTLLCYENPNTPPEFRPSLFVDVSAHIGRKIEALYQHVSQRSRSYLDAELIRGIARTRGQQARVAYAEAFEVVRMRAHTL